LARVAEAELAMTQPRPASRRHLGGHGILRIQLIVMPSFVEDRAWEVRQNQQRWCLCCPRVIEPGSDSLLAGAELVSFESRRLEDFYRRLLALTIPLGPGLDNFGGADGSLFQLAVFGNDEPQVRFQWWSVAPPQWQPVVAIVSEMIQGFLMAEGRSIDDCLDWLE
jgi:hypothetical protein